MNYAGQTHPAAEALARFEPARQATIGANAPAQAQTEVQYAAQEADQALRALEKVAHELVSRLSPVLTQEPPQPVNEGKAARAVSSPMATALYQHAIQTENLTRVLVDALRRLAL